METLLGNIEECSITCFSDAAFANRKEASSKGCHILFLRKDGKRFSPITRKSKKIQHAVKSALAADRLTLSDAIEASNNDTNRRLFQMHC